MYRLKYRMKNEGCLNSVKYVLQVFFYHVRNLFKETILDLKYSRRLLMGNNKSQYKHLGANDVYHTCYTAMPLIFKHISINPEDVLVDVGCGKGRVINYWLSQKLTNRIVGLELDPEVAKQTISQFSKWKNVEILQGDAIINLPSDGNVFYFYNPFSEEKVREFEQQISSIYHDKEIRIIYYNPKSIHVFNNNNWDIVKINFENDCGVKRWGRINKYHDLAIVTRCKMVDYNSTVQMT